MRGIRDYGLWDLGEMPNYECRVQSAEWEDCRFEI